MRYYHSHDNNHNWRSKSETWNLIAGVIALLLVLFYAIELFEVLDERIYYQAEQTFVSYEDKTVVTNSSTYNLAIDESIRINSVESKLQSGDTITLKISKLTGVLLEISKDDIVVYQGKQASWSAIISNSAIFVVVMALIVAFLYSVNAKNPPYPFSVVKQAFVSVKVRTPHHSDD